MKCLLLKHHNWVIFGAGLDAAVKPNYQALLKPSSIVGTWVRISLQKDAATSLLHHAYSNQFEA